MGQMHHSHLFFCVILHYFERIFRQNFNSLIYIMTTVLATPFLKFVDLPLIKPLQTIRKFPRLYKVLLCSYYILIKIIKFGMNNHLNFTDSTQ